MNTPSLLMCVGWYANGCGSAITLNRFPTLPSVSDGTAVIVRHVNDNASWLVRRGVPFGSPKRQPWPHNTMPRPHGRGVSRNAQHTERKRISYMNEHFGHIVIFYPESAAIRDPQTGKYSEGEQMAVVLKDRKSVV